MISSIKGVAKRSSVFASEIFTAISQISAEEPSEVIHIYCLKKNWLYWIKATTLLSLSKYENNEEK